MSAKKIGLGMCVVGVLAIALAVRQDSNSSFEDGSFIYQIGLFCGGVAMILAGLAYAIFGD